MEGIVVKALPAVTVIMPIRNEARHIADGVGSVLSQDYPCDRMEIIVADGMSDDGTREIIQGMLETCPNLKIVNNPKRIAPAGLNAAINQSRGEIIIRVDGHTVIKPDYVRQCVTQIIRTGADNVGGKMFAVGDRRFGKAVALATSSPFGVGDAFSHYAEEEMWVDTVYMGAWPRRVFRSIGMFDEELKRDQDDEFNYRLRKSGGKILLSPRIRSRYAVRSSFFALLQQYYEYGFWKVRVMQKHARQMRPRQFIPVAFTLALFSSAAFSMLSHIGFAIFIVICGAYLLANLIASVGIAAAKGWQLLPSLLLVHPTLHIGYGVGFLIGLLKFANRWNDRRGNVPSLREMDGQSV